MEVNGSNNSSPTMESLETKKKLRILCLHGYKQNGTIFKSKTAVLRKSMKDIAEFIYIDAPHIVDEKNGTSSWWRASKDGKEYRGWEVTLDYLREVFITQGPIDGVLGFSQGAVLCSLLCSISSLNSDPTLENNMYHNCFSFRFGLLFSGFQSRASIHQSLYPCSEHNNGSHNITSHNLNGSNDCLDNSSNSNSPQQSSSPKQSYPLNKIQTPSLHCWGKSDELILASNCESLSSHFSNPQIYEHSYGHLVPTSKADIQTYRNFLTTFIQDCSLE
ncbi:DUF341 family protein [Tieghemostelium lacteum]|uniref:DUF341 family protein n=1 Tax=Tieghemostelium lacteum TaxID=361077 RepID=A0A152A0J0_TIELA|nr:DUF341 family protein [Tieghemostelium lacteum]|eukprot:KYQ99757.1 DUF341 family protein [Tieghemostelium lacteum]